MRWMSGRQHYWILLDVTALWVLFPNRQLHLFLQFFWHVERMTVSHWRVGIEVSLHCWVWNSARSLAVDSQFTRLWVPLSKVGKISVDALLLLHFSRAGHAWVESRDVMHWNLVLDILTCEVLFRLENRLAIQTVFVFHQIVWTDPFTSLQGDILCFSQGLVVLNDCSKFFFTFRVASAHSSFPLLHDDTRVILNRYFSS